MLNLKIFCSFFLSFILLTSAISTSHKNIDFKVKTAETEKEAEDSFAKKKQHDHKVTDSYFKFLDSISSSSSKRSVHFELAKISSSRTLMLLNSQRISLPPPVA